MTPDNFELIPFKASYIHTFYKWLNKIPVPLFLFYALLTLIVGVTQHLVAYDQRALNPGELDATIGLNGLFLVATLMIGDYAFKNGELVLDRFRPLLSISEDEFGKLKYEFTTIPRMNSILFALLGAVLGYYAALSDMAVAPSITYIMPAMAIGIWVLSFALGLPLTYHFLRQLRLIKYFYSISDNLDLFDLNPVYGFSKYTAIVGIYLFIASFGLTIVLKPFTLNSQVGQAQMYFWMLTVLIMFIYPLSNVNQRLVEEKETLVKDVNCRIQTILDRLHIEAFENEDYKEAESMGSVLSSLREEKEIVEGLRTWPWKPGTLTGLVSALLLPPIVGYLREVISRIFVF